MFTPTVRQERACFSTRARGLAAAGVLLVLPMFGCGSEDEPLLGSATRVDDAGLDPTASTSFGMDGGITTPTAADAAAASDAYLSDAGRTQQTAELCDGLDNDGNGIVDDLDVAGDGVCDCLRIATLGVPGGSGQGSVFGAWLGSRSNDAVVALGGQVLTPELLAPHQILVVQDLHTLNRTYAPAELDALEAWVRAGGGLMTLVGYATPAERTNVNSMLARFGVSYGETQILRKVGANTVPVTGWSAHPVTQGVMQVGVDNGYPVQGSGATLASEGGFDLLKVQEVGMGHLIVWGDEWVTYDSEWQGRPEYQVAQLWVNAFKWLTVARVCQVPPVFL